MGNPRTISSLTDPVSAVMAAVPIKLHVHVSIAEAAEIMAENDIGAAPILLDNPGQDLAGILSERDVVRSLADESDPTEERVGDWMTADLIVADPDTTVTQATAMMLEGGIRHLPVVETSHTGHRRVVGMVSIRDLLAAHVELA